MNRQKEVLTTGEVAKVCNVAPRTVSKWFDSGQIKGYRIPGSKDRRIPLNDLVRFMKQYHIPLDGLMSGQTRVLIVDKEPDAVEPLRQMLVEQANYEVHVVATGFAAGLECERFRPHVMLLDMHLNDVDSKTIHHYVREQEDLQLTRVIATSAWLTDGQAKQLQAGGFDGFIKKPFNLRQVVQAVEEAVAVVY